MTNVITQLFSNYRWALVLLLFNLIVRYGFKDYPDLLSDPELSQSLKSVIELILTILFGLCLRIPRWVADNQGIDGAWKLFKTTLTPTKPYSD